MDEIKQRLKDASEACISTFEAWRGKANDSAAREALQEAVHELRKVAARLEIELAVSDRKTQGNEPIPIPSHRASRRPAQGADLDTEDDFNNNRNNNRSSGGNPRHQGGGDHRRPVQIRRPEASEGNGNAASVQPGNESVPTGGDDEGQRKTKPLSLRRGSDTNE